MFMGLFIQNYSLPQEQQEPLLWEQETFLALGL
jgi:hypothetical protein